MKSYYKNIDGKITTKSILDDLYNSRYVLYEFVKRDLKLLYTQSISGPIFYMLFPLIQCGVFNFIINKFSGKTKIIDETFVELLICIIFWNLFSTNLVRGCGALIENFKIIKKLYIPRLVFYLTPFFSSIVTFLIQLVFFLFLYIFLSENISLIKFSFFKLTIFLFVILYTFILYFSGSLFVSAISIKYRDLIYLVKYMIQILLFLSPVLYSLSSLDEFSRLVIGLNPFSIVPELVRWIFFDNIIYFNFIICNIIFTLLFFILSIYLFVKNEKNIADLL